tara:strand:- start:1145 stop:2584 length:1440 start_codon:yes stop_codon:yes gene_type:complete
MSTFTGNNFINNNFFWFTGVIEDINDPLEMGRVRVRCYGYHTDDKNAGTGIPTSSLPWAHVTMPITSASVGGIGESATGILPGSWVVGFFRDGNACQDPLVIGTIPSRTPEPLDRSKGFCDPDPNGNPRHEGELVDNPVGATSEYLFSNSYTGKDELRTKTRIPYAQNDSDSPNGVPTAVPPGMETLKTKYPDANGEPDKFFERQTFLQPDQDEICEPTYPNCHTKETKSGHIIELDDTKSSERILEYHKTGTFTEVDKDGTETKVVVGNGFEVVFQDKNVNVKGNCNLTIDKDVRVLVKGDYYLEVEGDYYINAKKMVFEKIGMSKHRSIVKDLKDNIGGLVTTRIGKNEKRTIGANKKSSDSPELFNQDIEIFGNQDIKILGGKTEDIDLTFDLGVDGNTSMTFGGELAQTIGTTLTLNSQGTIDVDAVTSMTIDAPTGSLDYTSGNITVHGIGLHTHTHTDPSHANHGSETSAGND